MWTNIVSGSYQNVAHFVDMNFMTTTTYITSVPNNVTTLVPLLI